jgi:hypothetical protein
VARDERAELLRAVRHGVVRGARQHLADPQAPLDPGRCRGVEALGAHRVDDVAEGTQRHGVLAERREHPLDVGRVGGGGSDHEDPAGLVAAPVAVEQVCGTVQGHDGLAGAGATADLRDPPGAGPDRLVLVALDRRDDVAHLGTAAARDRGHESPVTDDDEVGWRLGDHEVVLDADDVGSLAPQHSPPQYAHRLHRGGSVERGGGRSPPVDDQRLVVVVTDAEPADVADLPLWAVVAVGPRGWSMSSRPKTSPSYWLSNALRRRAAWKTRASRSNSPVISSSRAVPTRSMRPRANPSASTRPARSPAFASSV